MVLAGALAPKVYTLIPFEITSIVKIKTKNSVNSKPKIIQRSLIHFPNLVKIGVASELDSTLNRRHSTYAFDFLNHNMRN